MLAYNIFLILEVMMDHLKIHHIGYLVKHIDKAAAAFEQLGYAAASESVWDSHRKIHILFMEKDGYRIELVSPADNSSVVSGLIKKYKNSPYHICYETPDLDAALAALASTGFTAIDAPAPAPALQNRRVVFLMSPFLGMIELLENRLPG